MRLRSLLILAAMSALAIPSTSGAAGATAETFDTVTVEADLGGTLNARLTATFRTRRFVTVNLNQDGSGQPPAGSLDDKLVAVRLTSLVPERLGTMHCYVDTSAVSMTVDQSDAVSISVSAPACPMQLSLSGTGSQVPYVRDASLGGPGRPNGFEIGYARTGTVVSASASVPEVGAATTADVANVTFRRGVRGNLTPHSPLGLPPVPAPPGGAPEVPAPPSETPGVPAAPNAPGVPGKGDLPKPPGGWPKLP